MSVLILNFKFLYIFIRVIELLYHEVINFMIILSDSLFKTKQLTNFDSFIDAWTGCFIRKDPVVPEKGLNDTFCLA